MKLEREFVRKPILVKHRKGDKVYEEAVIPLTITVPRDWVGKNVKIIVKLIPPEQNVQSTEPR